MIIQRTDLKEWHEWVGGKKESAAASLLQNQVKAGERDQLQDGLDAYEKEEINQAIVHTRQDIVLLVSYLTTTAIASNRIVRRLNVLIGIAVIFLVSQFL
jgi:hypothetical protein